MLTVIVSSMRLIGKASVLLPRSPQVVDREDRVFLPANHISAPDSCKDGFLSLLWKATPTRATLPSTCGCYFIYALSFFILTWELLCSRVRALRIVRRNVNRGLLLRARGNVMQKQFEGNCTVMWPREPEAIETLNITSGHYNMFCRAAWKNRKNLPWSVLGELEGFKYHMLQMFLKGP